MRILFIAPSISLGSGGVADYVCRLAEAAAARGHEVVLCGLRERSPSLNLHCPKPPFACGLQRFEMSSSMPWPSVGRSLRDLLCDWKPDVISLQFVNYGFGRWGLIHQMTAEIIPIIREYPTHVFFHELWQGHALNSSVKDRVIGWLQQRQILSVLRQLVPFGITTSIEYYQRVLAESGVKSDIVPIFGSVPVSGNDGRSWLRQRLLDAGLLDAGEKLESCVTYSIFASIHTSWPFERVISQLLDCAMRLGRRPVLVLFGRQPNRQMLCDFMAAHYGERFRVLVLGELPPEEIDLAISGSDCGLATTPVEGLGKSTAAAAFLERGVPLVGVLGGLSKDSEQLWPKDPLVLPADENLHERMATLTRHRGRGSSLPSAVDYYLDLFGTACGAVPKLP